MKKNNVILILLPFMLSACISFGGSLEGDAESLVGDLTFAHAKTPGGVPIGKTYYIAPFTTHKGDLELDEQVISDFQQYIYQSFLKFLPEDTIIPAGDITSKSEAQSPEVSGEAYELLHRRIAKELGADFLVLGTMNSMGLGSWMAEVELKSSTGTVLVEMDQTVHVNGGFF